eukprot:6594620-Prymnesium_polylepis.1
MCPSSPLPPLSSLATARRDAPTLRRLPRRLPQVPPRAERRAFAARQWGAELARPFADVTPDRR